MTDIKDIKEDKKDTYKMSFIIKKTEKLSSALYLVTNLISDKEPLRSEIRKKSAKFLSDIFLCESVSVSNSGGSISSVVREIDCLVSLVSLGRTALLISEMNASIITEELLVLKNAVETWGRTVGYTEYGLALSKEFFAVPENQPSPVVQFPSASSSSKGPKVAEKPTLIQAPAPERRATILAYLTERPGATLRDIATATNLGKEYSEKTIQRELVSLLFDGLIERVGERRWSRYSLKGS